MDFLRVAGVVGESIVDGPGLRLCVFVQGCPHGCVGCHNPGSHAPDGGYAVTVDEIVALYRKNPLLSGLTLSGGEPLQQAEGCLALVQALPPDTNVWLYTGYIVEDLLSYGTPAQQELLRSVGVVVDGPFLQAEKTLALPFRGSRNQRLLDAKATITAGWAVTHDFMV